MATSTLKFDRFYRYEELTSQLEALAKKYPNLCKLESIGQSHEGREIWLMTLTNSDTGSDTEKPALWIDGNIHATEVSASTAALYHIHDMLTKYGKDDDVTRALDTRAFYVVPRLNPDGAEWALADTPTFIRSGTRKYPFEDEPIEGWKWEDIDGDGRMLQMRIQDEHGAWKKHEKESRLMVRREPTETGGEYYRLLREGFVKNYDGVTIPFQPAEQGLDFNRNFPFEWRPEGEQRGAGPYPTSEPEIRAAVDFLANHKNVFIAVTFHTYSGVLLRPYGTHADEHFPAEDLWMFQAIGEKGTEMTDYPAISVFHEFKYHPKEVITGVFDDWLYEQFGVYAWTVELWSVQQQAGIEDYKYIDWFREHPVEDDLKILKWFDKNHKDVGYVPWSEFDHPQLGKVELGGWDLMESWRNPPLKFLEKEVARFPQWLLWQLLLSPRLELLESQVTALGESTYKVRAVVHNTGYLSTHTSAKSMEKKAVRGIIIEIELPEGASLESGKIREEHSQLDGRSRVLASPNFSSGDGTSERLKLEWVVKAPSGGSLKLTAKHERAGVVRTEIDLKD
jgi:murein tripeptide amidase MpaA